MKKIISVWSGIPAEEKKLTVPTFFTTIRIMLIPCISIAMMLHQWGLSFFLFVIAAATDAIDGFLARLRNEKTFVGACLDAVADKLLIITCFATLAFVQSPLFSIPLWFVLVVLCKEALLISGALYLFLRTGSLEVKPTILGKGAMLMQVCFITWLFACYFFHWLPIKTYYGMLGLLLFLVIASFIQYVVIGLRNLSLRS